MALIPAFPIHCLFIMTSVFIAFPKLCGHQKTAKALAAVLFANYLKLLVSKLSENKGKIIYPFLLISKVINNVLCFFLPDRVLMQLLRWSVIYLMPKYTLIY